ncbi:transcriptional regulator, TetR family [Streptomyces sp. AmelKG-E11A]|nr:transcriptional regulator, TetR family [Streptomyces sp. AmelKG-E11A]
MERGAGLLRAGAGDPGGGTHPSADGTRDLADGPRKGGGRIPGHGRSDRDRRTGLMAGPVRIGAMDSSSTRRQATRQKLYEAAVTLIAEQGFSATTVDEIAERAGVAKGTVYYNFASKSVLFEELLRHGVELLTASLRDAAESTTRAGGGSADALDAMVRAGLVFIERYPSFTQLYVAELWRTNRSWNSTLMAVRQQTVAVVEGVLRTGVERGELSGDIDVPLTSAALVGMVLVAALDWRSFQPERSLDDVHAALSRLLQGRVGGA